MKKVKLVGKGSRLKAKSTPRGKGAPRDFREYLLRAPKPAQPHLKAMRTAIRSVLPREATETISYGISAFKTGKIVVWIAGFAKHCSLFPTAAVIDEFRAELKDYPTAKGTIQFPLDKPLPIPLIKRIVKSRLAQMGHKSKR